MTSVRIGQELVGDRTPGLRPYAQIFYDHRNAMEFGFNVYVQDLPEGRIHRRPPE